MVLRLFIALVILLAVAAGLLTVAWREQIIHIIVFREFFDVSLPILGFGALVKYLCTCGCRCGCCHKD